jgi:hypothetical protein
VTPSGLCRSSGRPILHRLGIWRRRVTIKEGREAPTASSGS